jgi:nitric oxide reductase large subunit
VQGLFAATLFVSAFLLFLVQPLVGRMLLLPNSSPDSSLRLRPFASLRELPAQKARFWILVTQIEK